MRIIANNSAKYQRRRLPGSPSGQLLRRIGQRGRTNAIRTAPAYASLPRQRLLALNSSLGHTTEVLSGDYYSSLSTSSPHQIWSAAMVVNPILRGMLGLSTDATTQTITLTPHLPANWIFFTVKNVQAGSCVVDLLYQNALDSITLRADRKAAPDACEAQTNPALSISLPL